MLVSMRPSRCDPTLTEVRERTWWEGGDEVGSLTHWEAAIDKSDVRRVAMLLHRRVVVGLPLGHALAYRPAQFAALALGLLAPQEPIAVPVLLHLVVA
jgi:hypothetical protein